MPRPTQYPNHTHTFRHQKSKRQLPRHRPAALAPKAKKETSTTNVDTNHRNKYHHITRRAPSPP